MKRVAKFQEGGDVAMTAAERRRRNIQRLNERRSASRMSASERAEVERFNERMRQGTLTPDDMRRMGGRSDIERFSERAQRGTLTADDMRRMGGTPTQQAAPAPSMRDAVRPVAPGTPPRSAADMMRGAMQSPMARAMGTGRAAAGRAAAQGVVEGARLMRNMMRGTLGNPLSRIPDYGLGEGPAEPMRTMTPGYEEDMYAGSVAGRPAPRSQPARRRNVDPEGTQAAADAERERQRIAAIRGILEGGDIQPEERGFFERMGIRRTNETGMEPGTIEQRRNYLGSGAADTNVSYNKKGGLLKAKAPMKKGGKAMMYREGGKVRQGMQSPKAQEARAEMAEDVMKRSMPAEPKRRMRDMMSPEEGREYDAPLTAQERERMRSSGFKKGGMIKPKTAMKKGGVVKKAAGGKVAAPKKMMKGGMTSKPKKMMGGGRAMYAKGGMAKGCK